jgi:dsRNA-specific ribonuclease
METIGSEIDPKAQLTQDAWIGDAVLSLYARSKILREDGALDGPKSVRMTSNRFLSALGEPTKVEAEVGRIYAREGLHAAFRWIEERLMPLFDRQELNRRRKGRDGLKRFHH